MKLSTALDAFYESMRGIKSPNTILFYRSRLPSLLKTLGDMEVEDITILHLNHWRAALYDKQTRYDSHPTRETEKGGLSPFTIDQYIRNARRFFRFLYQNKLIPDDLAKNIERPPLPKFKPRGIPVVDRDKLISNVHKSPRDYAIILFLSDTACRVGGLSHLTLDDLDIENCRATVHEKGRGGNNKSRTVFFGEATQKALIDWLKIRPDIPGLDYVFIGNHNGNWNRLHENGVYQVLKRSAHKVGIEKSYNPHSFRHAAIRGLLANGMSLPKVSQIAGHSSTAVTGDIYGCFDENHLAARHKQFSWLQIQP